MNLIPTRTLLRNFSENDFEGSFGVLNKQQPIEKKKNLVFNINYKLG